jgi:hypothetical protein
MMVAIGDRSSACLNKVLFKLNMYLHPTVN